ncbi:HAD-IB family hydrolase [Streptomyces amakusaensis]|uniref:HAD family hydrolase n=1 Tax=Streptomyces amakusaensis TaxID=67271 RepID=A0ABW0AJA0_9ACTN
MTRPVGPVASATEGPAARPIAAAFFDVDETLVRFKSMFRFLAYHFQARGLPGERYREVAEHLMARAAAGSPRAETNRDYYRSYTGRPVREVMRHGEEWFAQESARGGVWHRPVVAALARHRRAGALIVLVSGSFPPCLEPVRRPVGADVLLCSRPEITDGVYTGVLETPVIGEEKARAALELLAERGISPENAAAYGDHASDLPLLSAVGHPVAVGSDALLRSYVEEAGGNLLPGISEGV